jgi:tetratricopeptide (TPR) repeat protein
MRLGFPAILTAFAVAATTCAADDTAAIKDAAVRLYDQGNYDEALKTLQELDHARLLDGPLLYRLFFCEKSTGQNDDAKKTLERARQALESEIASSTSLDVAFYLANTYSNLGRGTEARDVARDMTVKIESGRLAAPTSAIGQFQLGKLYQDQDRQAEASAAYAKAVDGFDLANGRYAGNARWALRYLGSGALARADLKAAETALARLVAVGGVEAADWDVLATTRARLGKYGPAAEAWKASFKLDRSGGDDQSYAARLAEAAVLIGPLPTAAPSGAAFTLMNQSDLQDFLKTSAGAVVAAPTRAAELMRPEKDGTQPRALDPELRAEIARTLLDTRRQFTAAGLEYAVRHYGIRETAFREGYAVLIFQDRAWELPPDPKPAVKKAGASGS